MPASARSARAAFPHRRAAMPGCRCSCAICRRSKARRRKGVVLYVHGATFPSALSIAHRFDGRSWRDELCAAGFHVWGFDFHGYGNSDPYPAMSSAAGWTRAALHRGGCQPAVRTGRAVHLSASHRRADFHHRAFVGHDRRRSLRCTLPWSGRSAGAVRRHRAARAAVRRSRLSGLASGFAAGSVAALHRGGAIRRSCLCCRVAISPNGASAIWTAIRPAGRERRPACRHRADHGSTSAAPGRAISPTSRRGCARRLRSSAASGTACAPTPMPPGCSERSPRRRSGAT